MLLLFVAGTIGLLGSFGLGWAVVQLGKIDSWWSPLRGLPPPGEMFVLLRGDRNGPFDSVLESVLDFEYEPKEHIFVPAPGKTRADTFLTHHGVAWVGFFRYLLHREVKYDKWAQKPNSAEWGLVRKTWPGPNIYFQYAMAVEVKAAETVGNFPVDAVIVFTVQIVNPVRAFFFAGGWEVQVSAAVTGRFRKHVADMTIDQLRQEQKASGATSVVDEILGLSDDLYDKYGVKIIDARFVQFDLVGGDTPMSKATQAKEIARLEKEADLLRGEGERDKRRAQAEGIQATVLAWGAHEVGGTVAMAEAIKEAKPNVIGGGVIASVDGKRGGA